MSSNASQLSFNFTRKHGLISSSKLPFVFGDSDTNDVQPKRRMRGAMTFVESVSNVGVNIADCINHNISTQSITNKYVVSKSTINNVANCHYFTVANFVHLKACASTSINQLLLLNQCKTINTHALILLSNCRSLDTTVSIKYVSCTRAYSAKSVLHHRCATVLAQSAINYSSTVSYQQTSSLISKQHTVRTQRAVPVPCRYYPIPEPPPEKPKFTCKIRPPASALPFNLTRKRGRIPSSALPFNLVCWHDQDKQPPVIPSLRSYIVHNVISATIAGIAVEPLDFAISCNVDGYCWSGYIDISDKDYKRIKAKMDKNSDKLISVTINNNVFTIIAEQLSRTRKFVNYSYRLSGRSVTSKLGSDYAKAQNGMLDNDNYASQIVNQQLSTSQITASFDIQDWLIPANQYSFTNKTPIAVIADIAKTAGGFIYSHASQPQLYIKRRYKKAAWELATATADVAINLDVITEITDEQNVQQRYNTVTLTGDTKGAIVYRQQQARNAEAPADYNVLYTDRDAVIQAGIAILSASGTHATYNIKILWSDKYSIELAQLGDIWQVNDDEGAWKANVTAVSVSISTTDDAPQVWQSVTLDRYLDV